MDRSFSLVFSVLFFLIEIIIENIDDKKHFSFWNYNIEINFMVNNSVLNVTTILNLCNAVWDANNNSIRNDIKSLNDNIYTVVAVNTSLLIVSLKLLCDTVALVLLVSKAQ